MNNKAAVKIFQVIQNNASKQELSDLFDQGMEAQIEQAYRKSILSSSSADWDLIITIRHILLDLQILDLKIR